MHKLIIPTALLFAINAKAQSVVSLENPATGSMTLSVLKADTMKIDAISITATYYGNEADGVVRLVPVWKKDNNGEQFTARFDYTSFDMTKPFKVVMKSKGTIIKTFEMSYRVQLNTQTFSKYEEM